MDELLRMAGCGLRVATVALPVGLAAWLTARRLRTPVFPRPTPDQARWNGFEVLAAFVLVQLVTPALVLALIAPVTRFIPLDQSPPATTLRTLWVGVLAFPAQLGLLYMVAEVAGRGRRPAAGARVAPARVAAGVLGWAALTPAVLGLHVGLGWLFREMGWATGEHPLARFGAGTDLQRALLVAQAGVTAPVVEELLFRGVLLGWLVGGRPLVRPAPGRRPAADRRVWWAFAAGVGVAALTGGRSVGPAAFALVLPAGWAALRQVVRRKRRTVGAVYASAALFAEVHSAVWPSPIPLFVLGLGLGWLAVRTRGVLAPAVVHGLFNLVSVLYVLRGGAG